MILIIDTTTPKAQPLRTEPIREVLGRDGNNAPIYSPLVGYRLDFGALEVCQYEELYDLCDAGSHAVTIIREDDMLPERYTGAYLTITRKAYGNGQAQDVELEITNITRFLAE